MAARTYRALWIDQYVTYTDAERVAVTPPDTFSHGFGTFLDRVAVSMPAGGVVLLDRATAGALGLLVAAGELEGNPAVLDAERAGWAHGKVSDWTDFHAEGRPTIHLALVHLLDAGRHPLMAPDPLDTVIAHAVWHQAAGTPWFGTPGMAGHQIMRQIGPQLVGSRARRPGQTPTWKPRDPGPTNGWEGPYEREHWRGPDARTARYAYALDANRAYVAAMGNVRLCPWSLRRTGRIRFAPTIAGWWLVELAPWTFDRLPDPAGYFTDDPDDRTKARVRWITTPTLELLEWATDKGIYGGTRILDSVTGPGYELLRPLKDRLRGAFDFGWKLPDADRERLQRAVKDVGHELPGSWNRSTNWIYRPDWWYSIVAMARCNLWRRMWHAGQSGIWPLWISVDKVWYPSATPEYRVPPGYQIDQGEELGRFTCEGIMRRKVRQ